MTLATWVLVLVGVTLGSAAHRGTYSDRLTIGGTQANTAFSLLTQSDRVASGYDGLVAFHSPGAPIATHTGAVQRAISNLEALPQVIGASDPLTVTPRAVSSNGRTAYISVSVNADPKTLGAPFATSLNRATTPLRTAGFTVAYGGDFDQLTRPHTTDLRSELLGFAIALVVLLLGFGSIIAAILPLATALISILIGLSILDLVATTISFGTAAPKLALMIGLGVGIDYALFLTTRFRQQMIDGEEPPAAVASLVATSGHAILVAAGTVAVALAGLYVSGITFIGQLGLAAVFGVATAAAGAITLVPAALTLVGKGVDRFALRTPVAEYRSHGDGWQRYAAFVGRHPWSFLASGVLVLACLAIPLLSIQIGHVGDGADPPSFSDKQAYDLLAAGFGAGANGPMTIVVRLSSHGTNTVELARRVERALRATPDVARMSPLNLTTDHRLLVGALIPNTDPQSQSTTNLFHRLVSATLPDALAQSGATGYVTGSNPSYIQFSDLISSRLLWIIAAVVTAAFLLIMAAFRSLLLALKAALANLLSICAAYGVLVAVFQWGWGRSLIGVSENVPIESYVPVLMFAIVFGLSMDYEIFLVSRVREAWLKTHDHRTSVAMGLSSTGRVITCAALIMASVFVAFVGSNEVVIKMLAVGLAASVLIDATIVRLVLVPAAMFLLGERSWWMPAWIERILARIES